MKLFLVPLFIGFFSFIFGQTTNPDYDSTLAQKYGGDDYGMKEYVLVILTTGKTLIDDKTVRDSLFGGHMENIQRLVQEGKLIVAGPLGKNDLSYRGIFIFDSSNIDEVKEWVLTDPAVKEGLLATEIFPWYGSAALPSYIDTHKKIEKTSF